MNNKIKIRTIASDLGFGDALEIVMAGGLVSRKGWNGKGMFIFLRPGGELNKLDIHKIQTLNEQVKLYYSSLSKNVIFTPMLCMKAADDTIVNGWLASQTDMLAEDWCHLEIIAE